MENQSLQTVEALIRVGIGRYDKISSVRSELRLPNSVVIFCLTLVRFREKKKDMRERRSFCREETRSLGRRYIDVSELGDG